MSAAYPADGFAVTPENASLPPHCIPMQSLDNGSVSRFLSLRIASFFVCHFHEGVNHGIEAFLFLENNDIFRCNIGFIEEHLYSEFLTAKSDYHELSAEVWMFGEIF